MSDFISMFEKKKIQIETLSEYLSSVRKNLGLSLEEVAQKTGVKPKFLNSLEKGEFVELPAQVYVAGFLRQLAYLYGVEPEVLIQQYKKEQSIDQQLKRQAQYSLPWPIKLLKQVVITPKLVSIIAGLVFVIVTVSYITWQVLSINKTPRLEILEPRNQQIVKGTSVMVKGKTDPGTMVTINDENVFVDREGNFNTQLGLSPGSKELVFVAKNRFDNSVTKTLTVIAESEPQVLGAQDEKKLELVLEFNSEVTLDFSLDEGPKQTKGFVAGQHITLAAKRKIIISTSNAGATQAILNGKNLGVLGRNGEQLENIPFSAESDSINNKQ